MLLTLLATAFAADTSGFVEVRAQAYTGVDGLPLTFVERARPTFEADLHDRVVLSSTIELGMAQGWNSTDALEDLLDDEGLTDLVTAAGVTFPEHENELLGIDSVHDYLSVDRLFLDVYTPHADIRVGRQAVNWGSAFLVNPTDPFPEVLLTQPWKPRSGVNAVRASVPFGELNQVQLVVGSDSAFTNVRVAARSTFNVLSTDLSLLGAYRQEAQNGLVGLDIRGNLGVGFWFEGALHLDEDDAYEELAAGIDYSFPVRESLMVTAQYYRNGSGQLTQDASFNPLEPVENEAFGPMFRGRDYAMASASLGVIPELSASALWIQNLNDGSALAVPSISVMPPGRFEISASAQIPLNTWGDGGELKPADDDLVLTIPDLTGGETELDLGRVVPDATFTLWTRFNF